MLQAIIFDFDGTIVDSEPVHFQATQKTLAPFGVILDLQTHLQECVGYRDLDNFRRLSARHSLELDLDGVQKMINIKLEHYQRLIKQHARACAGAIPLIKAAAEQYPL